jgi:hypothetical protein
MRPIAATAAQRMPAISTEGSPRALVMFLTAALAAVLLLLVAPPAHASHLNQTGNPCLGHTEGEGIQLPPGSGIWYQCVQQNGPGNLKAEPRPDWPEVPAALLWPASALAAFGVYLLVQRRRSPHPVPTL